MAGRPRILVLYDAYSTFTQTVIEHLRSFALFSRFDVTYAHGVRRAAPLVSLDLFDAVIVHYSIRLSLPNYISPAFAEALAAFKGAKAVFIQDEYDTTETAREWFQKLGIDVVFTCVPPAFVELVYPKARFPGTEFVTVLTGYVPPKFETNTVRRPISDRKLVIAYRGRPLSYWYGKLGREKLVIGQQMKKLAAERGVPVDIEWTEESRIYGEGWYDFLASAKATLGTESGANIFDDTGEIKKMVVAALKANPALSFEEAFERFLAPHEGKVRMNQISPKVFESIALGTALVLYEGEYSGVLKPNEHYLPLKKDLSNADAIFAALRDDAGLQAMADRAHRDILGSGRWSYAKAVADFDLVIGRHLKERAVREPFLVIAGSAEAGAGAAAPLRFRVGTRMRNMMTSAPLRPEQINLDAGYVPILLKVARKAWGFSRLGVIIDRFRGWND